ncbi:hypothetical protein [Sphingomonas turrisvirgatae]|uniref:hypothetical protein n=1 Tax=Sphingomonas turrisvirgatae TaxID=1888892 RepID=UPI0010427632|nr:hypothetical protein [Sphingomonas turrisvirgatae]
MVEQWIDASKALKIAGDNFALCSRLHSGLVTGRAAKLQLGEEVRVNAVIPKGFWWATGHEALEQNWESGDFSTWIERTYHWQAFGVHFGLSGLLAMVPFEQRAIIAREFSAAGSPDWATAKEARRIAYNHYRHNPMAAGGTIIEQAKLGFIGARAVLAQASMGGPDDSKWTWEEREWDVPTWFWTDFTATNQSSQDWELGRFAGRGLAPDKTRWITLSGVHFYRPSLASLGPVAAPTETTETTRGRKPKYDWPAAISACWGRIYRGEPPVANQADVEKLLIEILRAGDDEPGESTVRPYASQIWAEYSKP